MLMLMMTMAMLVYFGLMPWCCIEVGGVCDVGMGGTLLALSFGTESMHLVVIHPLICTPFGCFDGVVSQVAESWWYFENVLKENANRCLYAEDSSSKFAASYIKVGHCGCVHTFHFALVRLNLARDHTEVRDAPLASSEREGIRLRSNTCTFFRLSRLQQQHLEEAHIGVMVGLFDQPVCTSSSSEQKVSTLPTHVHVPRAKVVHVRLACTGMNVSPAARMCTCVGCSIADAPRSPRAVITKCSAFLDNRHTCTP